MKIQIQYHPENHHVTVQYGSPIRRLFKKTSETIPEVFSPEAYAQVCREAGEMGPHELARGVQLLRQLGNSRAITASGEEFNFSLSLVAWTILLLAGSKRPTGALPVALTALAFTAPISLPEMQLPEAKDVLDKDSISPEAWLAYEEIRSVEARKLGAIPVVNTAHYLWKELQHNGSPHRDFRTLVGVLETSSVMYRRALDALRITNLEESEHGGGR